MLTPALARRQVQRHQRASAHHMLQAQVPQASLAHNELRQLELQLQLVQEQVQEQELELPCLHPAYVARLPV